MGLDLKSIVSKSDLKTLTEMQSIGIEDDNQAYELMLSEWQQKIDFESAKEINQKQNAFNAYWDRMALFSKWFVSVCSAVIFTTWLIGTLFGYHQRLSTEAETRRLNAGYLSFDKSAGEQPLKNAPPGVTLTSMERAKVTDHEVAGVTLTHHGELRYTLNLPSLPKDQVYAVSHEMIGYNDQVWGTGLYYTRPGESGIVRFEKKFDSGPLPAGDVNGISWLGVSVKIVDAGSGTQGK